MLFLQKVSGEYFKNIKYIYAISCVSAIILNRLELKIKFYDKRKIYTIEQLSDITSVVKNFQFFVQEKWKIATDKPGSGNTKNIGSVNNIEDLINGKGIFSELGEDVFDDYWMYYLTEDMAKKAELPKPFYKNLDEYKQFKHID